MNTRTIRDITDFIFMQDPPAKCDIILIPGTSQSAVTETAATLYHAGFTKYVLPSGMYSSNMGRFARENIDNPRYDGNFRTDWEYCAHILTKNGVPLSAILREERATNSMENAEFSSAVLREAGIPVYSAILCCQAFHARRAYMSYGRFFPDTKLIVVPTNTQGIRADNWYRSEKSYRKVMSELAKCGAYFSDIF